VARGRDNLLRRPELLWPLYVALWSILSIVEGYQSFALAQLIGRPMPAGQCFALAITMWYTLAALAPLLVWVARRHPLEPGHWRGPVLVLLGASAGLALVKVILDLPVEWLIRPKWAVLQDRTVLEQFQILFSARFVIYLLVLWLVLGVAQALDYYRKFRDRELRASDLEAQLALAQLQVLKMQLQPHFLFNTLHAISALVHQDAELADQMIARLGELLRTSLENAGTQEVSLREELEFVQPYLEIEQARLGPRLTLRIEVDPEVMDARVPNLFLQPLVENAVRHGIAPHAEPGVIEVRACREGDALKLTVRDNGRGLSSNYTEGVGVGNTRARLAQLYGGAQQFTMRNHPEGGLLVTVTIPFQEEAGGPDMPDEDEAPRPEPLLAGRTANVPGRKFSTQGRTGIGQQGRGDIRGDPRAPG
jgi:signal transduction histidine kinase